MALHKLDKSQWWEFCDRVSQGLAAQPVDIEIASPEEGVQPDARWLRASALTFDPEEGAFEIILANVGHLTLWPRELYIDYSERGIDSFCVLDQANLWHIVLLREPLMLPPLQSPAATQRVANANIPSRGVARSSR